MKSYVFFSIVLIMNAASAGQVVVTAPRQPDYLSDPATVKNIDHKAGYIDCYGDPLRLINDGARPVLVVESTFAPGSWVENKVMYYMPVGASYTWTKSTFQRTRLLHSYWAALFGKLPTVYVAVYELPENKTSDISSREGLTLKTRLRVYLHSIGERILGEREGEFLLSTLEKKYDYIAVMRRQDEEFARKQQEFNEWFAAQQAAGHSVEASSSVPTHTVDTSSTRASSSFGETVIR